ncbi:hypothetical protein [Mesorhizobium sp. CN2-181]|uniref:hypothetical protein n=1 Tax=Mesorhizobium yinganensis TaxID=3157707 RepID=UPI0032B7D85B
MEGLDLFADLSSIDILGGAGVINYWYDFVSEDGFAKNFYPEPVFSGDGIIALRNVHNTMEEYLVKIEDTLTTEEAQKDDLWLKLSTTAAGALLIFRNADD